MEARDIMPLLQHLLRSNVVPMEGEVELVRKVIIPQMLQEAYVIERYNRHQLDFKHVKDQIDFYKASAALWNTTLSVIRRIPAEILTEIFLRVRAPYSAPGGDQGRYVDQLSWNVSQVCRHWRWTALCTPALWRRLPTIDLRVSTAPDDVERHLRLLRELLKRSNYASLDVYIHSPESKPSHPLLKYIAEYSDIWTHLKIESTFVTMHGLKHVKGSLPALTMLQLNFVETTYPYIVHKLEMFSDAPSLRRVGITGKYLGKIALPYNQLEMITDESIWTSRALRDHSTTYTNLTEMSLSEASDSVLPVDVLPVLKFPSLVTLFLSTSGDLDASLLKIGIFPVLKVVWVGLLRDVGNIFDALRALVLRSGCSSILSITVDEKRLYPRSGLLELLCVTPHLKRLEAVLPSEEDLFHLSSSCEGTLNYVPDLLYCNFYVTQEFESEGLIDAIYAFAYSRWPRNCGHLTLESHDLLMRANQYRPIIVRHQVLDSALANNDDNTFAHLDERLFEEVMAVRAAQARNPEEPLDSKNVQMVMAAIEDFPAPDIGNIIASNIHITLSKLVMEYKDHLAEAQGDHVFKLALRTLQKWRPMFEEIASQVRWVRKPGKLDALMFVSEKCRTQQILGYTLTSNAEI
ncbi:hypothetical protein D9619_011547 [Psilocybe cf. subviscida]|uniref:F-box domain-containing protein n=1 Tax=Psilocybe cf. subviscida TaxID=2480587 RepID=A0A8H5F9I2_9AGAR|nr:hypothetical protein D9619_011547 [Psilocybe cf. subviscida]